MSYSDTCEIVNTNNSAVVVAEILEFKPSFVLTVSINRSIKVVLRYDAVLKLYVGNMAGMEMTSTGPKEQVKFTGRKK
mgnify:CR=1 FL=1|jgi:hypothetical protein|tara:strand:+ start:237 stop:470 length:234 start_codon:yes stop_codon:yes gene_type:complete